MNKERLVIEGMGCNHCITAIKKELEKLDLKVNDIKIGYAEVEFDQLKIQKTDLRKAIEDAGYRLSEIQDI